MAHTIHVDVVSAEEQIFSGEAEVRRAAGRSGRARHLPAPHAADHAASSRARCASSAPDSAEEEFVFVAGGILEVQPNSVTVLADTAIRGKDLDEAKATEAKQLAEEAMKNAKSDIDFAKAQGEFARWRRRSRRCASTARSDVLRRASAAKRTRPAQARRVSLFSAIAMTLDIFFDRYLLTLHGDRRRVRPRPLRRRRARAAAAARSFGGDRAGWSRSRCCPTSRSRST